MSTKVPTITLVCRVHPPDGFNEYEFLKIDLTLKRATWLLTLMDVATALKERHDGFYRIEFWDYCDVGKPLAGCEEVWEEFAIRLDEYEGCVDANPGDDPWQRGQWREPTQAMVWSETMAAARSECERVRVDENTCLWEFYATYADRPTAMESQQLSRDILVRLRDQLLMETPVDQREQIQRERKEIFSRIVDLTR